ncbi:hypothetical protein [Curtobacterium pusillum]|uniref:hypothetical protein n=1 Tax=Curtobacterium pusillum TaxID=69373 RepID=UPI0011A84EAA|nr:hypothetical protein [Curtobacterium pusillum]
MNDVRFDPQRDAAIRTVLRDEVAAAASRSPLRRFLVAVAIVVAGLLALGGGGYALAAAHPELFGPRAHAPAAPTSAPAPQSSTPVGSPIVPTEEPTTPRTTPPAADPTPTQLPVPAVPVIVSPTDGATTPGGTITIAGTGSPGSHVYLTEYCTLAPPACTIPEEIGQPWQPQVVVGADGRWSTTTLIAPPQTLTFRLAASAAFVSADGSTVGHGSGSSPDLRFTVTGSGG